MLGEETLSWGSESMFDTMAEGLTCTQLFMKPYKPDTPQEESQADLSCAPSLTG